jgi:carboxyl-terminal processing protease
MKRILYFIIFFIGIQTARAQMPDSVRMFVDSALHILQYKSIFAKKVDWKKVRDSTYQLAKDAQSYKETATALHYAFDQLGDKHGWLVIDDSMYRNDAFVYDTNQISADIRAVARKGPRIYARRLGGYAYLSIPFFGDQTLKGMNRFAQQLQDSLCKVVSTATRGIIIDLRLNAGGNMFPMFVGIGNILGDGMISQSVDADGNTTASVSIVNGSLTLLDTMVIKPEHHCGDLTELPVAVITGPVTGSAGECLAVGIRGRNSTILIGETTAGYTSSNNGYLLPGVNNGIVTAMDYLHDRNGKEYRESVEPDIVVKGDHFFEPEKDEKIVAAIKWLEKEVR